MATWSGGSGSGYQIRAGYGFIFSSYRSMGTTQTLTLTSETNPYDGASGLRNTTGGSDIFVVQVIDNNGTGTFNSTSQTTAIACAGTTTTTSTSTTTLPQVWYLSYNCATGATTTSTNYVDGTFQENEYRGSWNYNAKYVSKDTIKQTISKYYPTQATKIDEAPQVQEVEFQEPSETGINSMSYQQEPNQIIWCVRGDGRLVGLTYQREQQAIITQLQADVAALKGTA